MNTITDKTCTGCGEAKPLDQFGLHPQGRCGRQSRCRECYRKKQRAYRATHVDQERERARQWKAANPERTRDLLSRWKAANPERTLVLARQSQARMRASYRQMVFDHYGWLCKCCGGSDQPTIDHIDGDGRAHRTQLFGRQEGGQKMYRWLVQNGFPPEYQTLCLRCNTSKKSGPACQLDHTAEAA